MLFDMAAVVQDGEPLRPISLYVEQGIHRGESFPLPEGTLVIGRGSAASLRFEHDSISRRHATLTRRGNQLILRDLGSQNGTYVNRQRISGDVELQIGDDLAIGQCLLKVTEPDQKAPPARSVREQDFEDEPWRPRKTPVVVVGGAVIALAVGIAVVWVMRPGKSAAEKERIAKRTPPPAPVPPATPVGESRQKSTSNEVARPPPTDGVDREALPQTAPEPAPSRPKGSTRSAGRARAANSGAALARYKFGDVAGALEAAKDDGNVDLQAKLSRFDSTLSAARERLSAGDNAAALRNFILALKIDEGISSGVGVYAAQMRKQLGSLYALEGNAQMENNDARAAKQAFTLSLKYEPSNEKAKAALRKLQTPPAAKAQIKLRRTSNRERAAAIDAAFGN